jgi:diguanylate cyclase (GGDEF)-like protein
MLMELENTRERLAILAATESLTGLANRRSFSDRLRQEHAAIQREGPSSCLLMADLDHFKKINHLHRHHVGDEALRTFAEVCKRVLRASDVVGRWGGEEFLVLLPRTSMSQAVAVAERLRETFCATPIPTAGDPLFCTTSIGVVEMTAGRDLDGVLRDLDATLYEAKEEGRNQTVAA